MSRDDKQCETPRTNAVAHDSRSILGGYPVVTATFARQLERELAKVTEGARQMADALHASAQSSIAPLHPDVLQFAEDVIALDKLAREHSDQGCPASSRELYMAQGIVKANQRVAGLGAVTPTGISAGAQCAQGRAIVPKSFNLTPQQVDQLRTFAFGEGCTDQEDAMEVTIGWLDKHEDGPGWYVWAAEYPEEGSLPLVTFSRADDTGEKNGV